MYSDVPGWWQLEQLVKMSRTPPHAGVVRPPWQDTLTHVVPLNTGRPELAFKPGAKATVSVVPWFAAPLPPLVWHAAQFPVILGRARWTAWEPLRFGALAPSGGFPWQEMH